MGICDHNITLNIYELRTLKQLLLSYSLAELSKIFKPSQEKQLYALLQQIETIEKKYI